MVLSDGDADCDRIPDSFEIERWLDPLDPGDADEDSNGNGLTHYQEYVLGIEPSSPPNRFSVGSAFSPKGASELTLPGKAGRLPRMMRTLDLAEPSWVEVDSTGPLETDRGISLADALPFDRAFYKIEVTLPWCP